MRKKLDIRNILNTVIELEKFKQLFFDNNQYCIFQHLPKPLLYSKNIYKKEFKIKPSSLFSLSHMEAFWRKKLSRKQNELLYEEAIESLKTKKELDAIDERLLEMIGISVEKKPLTNI